MNTAVYDAMVTEAQKLGYPQYFTDDLYKHDRAFCERPEASEPFGWIIRKCGTHILIPGSEWAYSQARYYSKEAYYDDPHFFWYTDSMLIPAEASEIVETLRKSLVGRK